MKPQPVTSVESAFPGEVDKYLPNVPLDWGDSTEDLTWFRLQEEWFAKGLPNGVSFVPKPGVDAESAFRHLMVIQGSHDIKHEVKRVAVAYLASQWLTAVLDDHGMVLYGTSIQGQESNAV